MAVIERSVPTELAYEFDPKHPDTSAKQILEQLHPDWSSRLDKEALQVEIVTGGYTNTLLVAYFNSNPNEKVLIRIYGEGSENFIDRAAELGTLRLLAENNVAGEVYGLFANGMCYEYVPGQVLDREMATDSHISRLIARKMVHLHCVYRKPGKHPRVSLFDKMHKMLHDSYSDLDTQAMFQKSKFPAKPWFETEIEFLRLNLMSTENYSPEVFCHNDLYYRNILFDDQADKVKFIDFEYAGLNFQAYDIGNFFNELCGVDDLDYARYPSKNWQLTFLTNYVSAWNETDGNTDEQVTPESVQQAKSSSIEFDYVRYARIRLDEYEHRKAERFSE